MSRQQARERRRQVASFFFGIWGLRILLGVVLDDVGLAPDGAVWDGFISALSIVWVLALLALVGAFVQERRAKPDAEEEYVNFLVAFSGWEAALAQQGRQLNLAELHLDDSGANPEVVAYVDERSVPGERVVRRSMERDGHVQAGKQVSQQLGLYLSELTSAQWEGLELSTRLRPGQATTVGNS